MSFPGRVPWVLAFTLLLLILPAAGAAASGPGEGGVILVGCDDHYPPYEFLGPDGEPDGFCVELIREVARRQGLEIRIIARPWHEIRTALEQGEIDMLSGMVYSPLRDRTADFSIPHSYIPHALFIPEGSEITGTGDLDGRRLIVQKGDIMDDHAREKNFTSRIITAENPEEVLRLLAGDGGDAALLGYHQARYLIQTTDITGITHTGKIIEPLPYCFAVREGNGALLQELDAGLSAVMRDGTYDTLYRKWLQEPFVPDKHAFLIGILPWVLGGLGGVAAAGLIWSWSLRRAVHRRTVHLRREVEARQAAEEQTRRQQDNLQALLSATDDYELLLDRNGAIMASNESFAQFAGSRPGDLIGQSIVSFLPRDIGERVREWIDRALGSGREERKEISIGDRIFTVHLVPVHHAGTVEGVAVFARDVTDERALERQREVALSRIEKNLHQLATLNDEIRNPLAAIIGFADVGGGENAEEIIEQARRIDRIVSMLDQGWLESMKIRKFLSRHHHIGEEDGEE